MYFMTVVKDHGGTELVTFQSWYRHGSYDLLDRVHGGPGWQEDTLIVNLAGSLVHQL